MLFSQFNNQVVLDQGSIISKLSKRLWVGLMDKVTKRLRIREAILGDKDITLIVHCKIRGHLLVEEKKLFNNPFEAMLKSLIMSLMTCT
jgi:hypothetical protein